MRALSPASSGSSSAGSLRRRKDTDRRPRSPGAVVRPAKGGRRRISCATTRCARCSPHGDTRASVVLERRHASRPARRPNGELTARRCTTSPAPRPTTSRSAARPGARPEDQRVRRFPRRDARWRKQARSDIFAAVGLPLHRAGAAARTAARLEAARRRADLPDLVEPRRHPRRSPRAHHGVRRPGASSARWRKRPAPAA